MTTTNPSITNTNIIQRCQSHLEKEKALLQHFMALANQMQEAIGSAQVADLPDPATEEQRLLDEARALATTREAIQTELAEILELPVKRATIKALIDEVPGEPSATLAQLREDIIAIHGEIGVMAHTNQLLLQQSIELYQRILLAMTGQSAGGSTYSKKGQIQSSARGNLVSTDL